jgi:hypothetical protein
MLIGLILLVLVVVGLIVAFAAFAIFWIVMVVFWISTLLLALLVGDPYLGFVLAFPVTGVVFWAFSAYSDKNNANKV